MKPPPQDKEASDSVDDDSSPAMLQNSNNLFTNFDQAAMMRSGALKNPTNLNGDEYVLETEIIDTGEGIALE